MDRAEPTKTFKDVQVGERFAFDANEQYRGARPQRLINATRIESFVNNRNESGEITPGLCCLNGEPHYLNAAVRDGATHFCPNEPVYEPVDEATNRLNWSRF